MEINDYSQRLADARADYWESSKSMRDNYDKDIENLEKTHEYKEKKQADTFLNEKVKLETENESRSKLFADKTRREIAERQKEFTQSMKESEGDYNRKNQELRDNYKERLNRITSSFDNSTKQSKIQHEDDIRTVKNNYDEKYDVAKGNFRDELNNIRTTSDERFYDYQKNKTAEQKKLAEQYNDSLLQNNRDASRKLSDSNVKHDLAMENVKSNFDNEYDLLKTNKENTVNQLRSNHQGATSRLTDNFENVAEGMEKRFVEDNKRMSREHIDTLRNQEAKFNRDMAAVRAIASKNVQANADRMNHTNLEKARITEEYEGKLSRLRDEVDDYNYKQTKQLNQANSDFTANLREQKQESAGQVDALNRNHKTYDASIRARFRRDRAEAEARYLEAMRNLEGQYEEKLTAQEKNFKNVLKDNQGRHEHNTEMMSANHELALKDLNENLKDEKSRFIVQARRDTHNEKIELKEELNRNFELKNETIKQQLDQKEDELERVVSQYENKLAEIKKKASKEFERYQVLEEDRRIENQRTLKHTLLAKDQENSKRMMEMKRRYDKEFAKIKFDHEVMTKKMIEDYEHQIGTLKNESEKDLEIKLGMAQEEYNNLKRNSELRLEAVKTQYELKFDKMRLAAQEAEINRGNRGTA